MLGMFTQCERCNTSFECQKDNYSSGNKCWCDDIVLAKKTTETMSQKFCLCLCENCLMKLQEEIQ